MEGFRRVTRCLCAVVIGFVIGAPEVTAQSGRIEIRPRGEVKPAVTPQAPVAPNLPVVPSQAPAGAPLKTTLEIDITSISQTGDPAAQNWGKLFEELGYSTRIRVARDVKAGVTEKVRGTLRHVTVSALLSRSGQLVVGEKSFEITDKVKVQEWLDELKLYGAQGAPAGKPLWGLNAEQFLIVNEQMSQVLTIDSRQKTIGDFLAELRDQAHLPVRVPTATQEWLETGPGKTTLTTNLTGFSVGTGLAIALNELGAGMYPVRTPGGQIEYEVKPLEQLSNPWPLGWEPPAEVTRDRITPNLFQQANVGFENALLVTVLAAIADQSSTPIVVDTRRSLLKKIDVSQIQVSYPQRKTAWAMVVSQCVREAKLYNYYRQDEAGRGFVLVGPFEPKLPK